jgi:hypothetical protein
MQAADRPQVEIQVFGVELETFGDLMNSLLELHQRETDVFNFFGCERLLFKPTDSLALHQFPDEFNQTENQLDDRPLDVFWIRVPA